MGIALHANATERRRHHWPKKPWHRVKPIPAPIVDPIAVNPTPVHPMPITPQPVTPQPLTPIHDAAPGFYNNEDGSPIVALIQGAASTLDLEIYTMDDPAVRAAIRAALSRGVAVHIVKEPAPLDACKVFGNSGDDAYRPRNPSTSSSTECADEQSLVSEVTQAGGTYVPFVKEQLCGGGGTNCFQHGKIAIADGRTALVSTGNFDLTNLCDTANNPGKCDRDYTVVTEDTDVVGALSKIISTDALGRSYDVSSLLTPAVASKLTVSPLSMNPLVDFIKSARPGGRVQIQNQYLKDPTLNQAIMDVARSGVRVEVQVSSACAFGTPKPSEATEFRAIFEQFERAGVKTSIFTSKMTIKGLPGYLHAKAIVVDGRAWIGSVNGSTESLTRNREFGVFIDDASEVARLSSVMETDLNNADSESWEQSLTCSKDRTTQY